MRIVYRILTAVLFVLTVTFPTRVSAQYTIEKELGSKALGLFQFSEPRSVVSSVDGYFYVGDKTSVYKMSPTGEVVTQWKHPYQFIQDLALDHDQNLIVATYNRVYRLTSELSLINDFGISGEGEGQINNLINIATDSNNNIYILDRISGIAPSQGVFRVQVFSASGIFQNKPITVDGGYYNSGADYSYTQINNIAVGGNNIVLSTFSYASGVENIVLLKSYSLTGIFQNDIGSRTPGADQMYNPLGIAFDSDGNILISESYKLYKFSISGLFISATLINGNSSYFSYPIDLAVEPDGNLLMADIGNEKIIERFTSTGQSLAKFGRGDGEGQFRRPRDAAKDSHGNIYILDSENFRVQKFDEAGNFLLQFGSRGGEYGFLNPNKLEIDNNDNVFILDNPKIFKYDTNGNLILSFGNNVNADGRYIYPIDMETDSENNLYVLTTDYQNVSYVEKFNNNGQSVSKFGNPGQDDGQLSTSIYALAVDNRGDIYINDFSQSSGAYRLQQFSNSGAFIKKVPVSEYLQDIEVDKYNNLYWSGYNSINRITPSGTSYPIYTGGGENIFLNAGFYIDATSQTLIITDQSNNKVIKLSCSLPKPLFSVAPALAGMPSSFTDESTNIAPSATYLWDYGDGTTNDTKGNTQHVYEVTNDYTAHLTIEQACIAEYSREFSLLTSLKSDSLALVDFYHATNGQDWANNTNWLSGKVNTWYGVGVENDRVVELKFAENNKLAGSFTSSFSQITGLKRLIISNNSISGPISEWIDRLSELRELDLSNNQLHGKLSDNIGELARLESLNLAGNHFTDSIPSSIGRLTSLHYLSLEDNDLTGRAPSSLTNLVNATEIRLANNEIIELTDLSSMASLQSLSVENNQLNFDDIEMNLSIENFTYVPQNRVRPLQDSLTFYETATLSLSLNVGGSANEYQWFKDGQPIAGATSYAYTASNIGQGNAGQYHLQITNTLVPNLTLLSSEISVLIVPPPDNDQDGFNVVSDCNDNDASIYPGAIELCDGKDNNCDGIIDDGCVSPQLWGLTKYGGPGMAGTIFSVYGDGSNAIQLKNSFLASLRNPSGGLLAMPDSSILVTNSNGGINDYGGISRIDKNATESTFFAFGLSNGVNPFGGLVNGNDGWLYGMTALGGAYYFGTIYKIRPDGSGHSVLHEFQTDGNGGYPFGSLLIATDGLLYGMTAAGGPNGEGTIFRINKDGSDYSVLRFFSPETGTYPTGTLIQLQDGELYGTTAGGGEFNFGTVFKMTTDGSSYQVLHHFNNDDGNSPTGFLTLGNDGLLYGQTISGGLNSSGTIFRIAPENNQFSVIYHFDGVNGQLPNSRLYQKEDGSFIGSTIYGGSDNRGTIFRINPDGTGHTLLHSLLPSEGWAPSGNLVIGKDNYLYGITLIGGATNSGTVFKINLDGSDFSTIHSYGIQSGTSPVGNLVQLDSETIVGTALEGGNFSSGTIFKINADGTNYAAIHHFDYPTGVKANGLLMKGSDNFIYGTTAMGGGTYAGTLFKIKGDGSEFSVLHGFDFTTGYEATGVTEGSDGILYGAAKYGGNGNSGILFKINKDGSDYSVIQDFDGSQGSNPVGLLVQSKTGALYGMTNSSGRYGYGTVFKVNPDGTDFMVVHHFSSSDGAYPNESLTISENGVIYGMTQMGGINGNGTIFKIGTDDSFSVMYNFDYQNGSQPGGSLTIFKNQLFGYTAYGGQYNGGVVFSYDLNSNQFTKVVDLNDFTGKNPLNGRLLLVNPTTTEPPTMPSGSITFADVSNSSMTISFKPGNGDKRVVLMAEESASLAPVSIMDGTELSGTLNFGLATEYQTGWRVVYAGSDSTIAVTGLRGDMNYRVTVIEYNGAVTETQYLNDGAPVATQKTLPDVLAPTIAASNITFSAISYTTMQVNFVKGNGEQRLVVMKEGSAPAFTPANDSFYTGSLENGESVIYNGYGNSINLSDLLPGATYYLKIFEFNTDSTYTRYLIDGAPSASQRTVPDVLAPTVSASSITFSSVTPTSMKLNFTVGNGEQRLIIMKSGSQPSFIPADHAFYSGTVNAGETVIYNGSGNTFDLSNLLPGATYYLKVFEFNTDSTRTRYLTSTAPIGVQQTPQLPAVYLITPADGSINQNANDLKVAANKLDKVKTYTIELSTSSDFGAGVLSKSGVRNQTFSGLRYNTTYFARVKTDLSPFYGKVTSFTTAPPQFFAYVISPADGAKDVSTSVTVSSNPLPEATSYTIELNTSSNFDGTSNVKTAASPNILFAGLNKRTTYYARVFTNLAQGLWGKSTSFTTGSVNKSNLAARDSENTQDDERTSEVFAVDILENPFKQRLTVTIKTPVEEEAALRLSDMTGKIIFQSSEKTNRAIEIDRPMVQGVYLIHVRTVSGTKIVRVVKVD